MIKNSSHQEGAIQYHEVKIPYFVHQMEKELAQEQENLKENKNR